VQALRCRRCTMQCPMGIAVSEEYAQPGRLYVATPECTLCGDCIDACPSGMLYFGVRPFRSADRGESDLLPIRQVPQPLPAAKGCNSQVSDTG